MAVRGFPLRGVLGIVRLPGVFSALANVLAGYLIVTRGAIQWSLLLPLLGASALFYCGGMVLNDYFDYGEDLRLRPSRPIPSGAISRRAAGALAVVLLTGGFALAALGGARQLLIAGLLLIFIIAYDALPRRGAASVMLMAGCRSLNCLLGLSAVPLTAQVWPLAVPVFFYIAGVTLLSRDETRAEDKTLLYLCGACMMLAAASLLALFLTSLLPQPWLLFGLALGLAAVLQRLKSTLRNYRPAEIRRTVGALLLGMVALDALLLVGAGLWWGAFILLFAWWPAQALARHFSPS